MRGWWRRRTLRVRVVAVLLSLLAGVSAVVGTVSVLSLDHYLRARIDDQLAAASGRSQSNNQGMFRGEGPLRPLPRRVLGVPDGVPGFILAPGQAEGTVAARIVGGAVAEAGVLDRDGVPRPLDAAERQRLLDAVLSRPGGLVSADLGEDLDDYRLASTSPRGPRMPSGRSAGAGSGSGSGSGAGSEAGVGSGSASQELLVTGLPLAPVHATVMRTAAVVTAVAVLGLVLAAALGWLIVGRTLLPLRRVALTARRVTAMPLDRGQVDVDVRLPAHEWDDRTEVGQVGAALNTLLDHMTSALNARHDSETRVRRFVADASHELRTPLAAIRGYAELTRRDRELFDSLPPQVVESLARIEGSALRMTSLVDDLLLLARLDSGRPLDASPVDLVEVCADAFADAGVAGPEHDWALDVPDDPVLVVGDAERLHQVVANLLANARTHTPPGTRVRLALRSLGPDVELSVSDDGPGIAPDVLPHVFGRFVRADSSRSRAAGSTGLGLAIVAAVVQAHSGRVGVASEPGRGTVFTVRLPASVAHGDAGAKVAPFTTFAPASQP
ncbi:MAG: HAMP domain-containing sensor histidine kinase [Kineosporiaceae bacterium]